MIRVTGIKAIEADMRDIAIYELADGKRVNLDARGVRQYGAATILREMGYGDALPTERAVVIQRGKKVGTVPPDFDPTAIKSKSFFYDVRPHDFVREGDRWIAHYTLGPGDLEAVPGFVWERQ